jgi:hypothetical protein
MRVSGWVLMRHRGFGLKLGPSRLLSLAVTILAVILVLLMFAGTATAAPVGPAAYSGVSMGVEAHSPMSPASAAYAAFTGGGMPTFTSPLQNVAGSVSPAAVTVYEESDTHLVYSGVWTVVQNSEVSGWRYSYSESEGASVTVKFNGNYLGWVTRKADWYGKVRLTLDGIDKGIVDLYSSTEMYQVTVWSSGLLNSGNHTLKIERTGTKNIASAGTTICMDAFAVNGTLTDEGALGTGILSGKVTNSSGTGLANGYVLVWDEELNLLGSAMTVSGGAYAFTGLPNEPLAISTVNNANYIDEWYNNVRFPGNWEATGAAWLDFGASATRAGINFSLVAGKSISGVVRNWGYQGASGVEVLAYDLSGNFMLVTESDSTGAYSIKGLPPGIYNICTFGNGYFTDEWYDDDPVFMDPDASSAVDINISSSNATAKEFLLDPGYVMGGVVHDSSGVGLPGVYIHIQSASFQGLSVYTQTNDLGGFAVDGLPEGMYVACTLNDQGYVDEWYEDDVAPADMAGTYAKQIEVDNGGTWSIVFTLDKGCTISGTVTDNAVGGALKDVDLVEVFNGDGKLYASSYVGGEYGTAYTTWALPSGTYYVRTDYGSTSDYIDEWYNDKVIGVFDHTGADPVVVGASNVTGIDFGLDPMTRYEQTDPHIYYAPSVTAWTTYSAPAASGGSYNYSSSTSAAATIYFNGTRLDASVMMGTTTGSADFYVDNVKTGTINLAASPAEYNVKAFTTGGLPSGPHKVEIKYTSTNASGKRITLDAVDVAGVLTYAVPIITSVAPNTGFTLGGETVVMTGANLSGAISVTFGGTPAASITSNSATQITAVTPAHGAGSVQVQVTTSAGTTTDTSADDYTYAVPGVPTITSVSPNTGSIDGGTTVTITGSDFAGLSGTSAVTFDGMDAQAYLRVNATTITAVAPAHAAGTVRVKVVAYGGATADTAKDDFTYTLAPPVVRYDQTDPNIVKTGTWADYGSPLSYLASYGRSSTASASATIWFTGTQLDYIAFKGTTTGYADIYLDGVKVTGTTPINLYSSPVAYQQNVWSTGPLPNALHSVKIVRSATSASGKYLSLDAVDIYGTIAAPPARYEQTNAGIHKTGSWTDYSNTTASKASYGRSLTADASATIHFTGERIDYIGFKGTTTGWVEVYLDGDLKATIDLAATTVAGNQLIWSSGTIGGGSHTLVLKRSGTSLATEYLTLDAVDIWGAIAP